MRAFRIKDRFYGWFCHPEGGFCPIASPEGKDLGFEKSRTKNRSFAPLRMTDKGNSEVSRSLRSGRQAKVTPRPGL